MATIQIKNVSEATHAELRRRAAAEGKSLQQYLLMLLDEQVARPTLDDWLDSLPPASTEPVSTEEIVDFLRIDRARH